MTITAEQLARLRDEKAAAAVSLARTVIDKYGADADKPSVHLATALIDGAHERDRLRDELAAVTRSRDELVADARRYRRLQVLGCAPFGSNHLARALVLRFSNLDEYVDADLVANPSRGEWR